MPAKISYSSDRVHAELLQVGKELRARRKLLGLTQGTVAAAAHVCRVTVTRIEGGSPNVTAGAYAAVLDVLGLKFAGLELTAPTAGEPKHHPASLTEIDVRQFPQLRELAWNLGPAIYRISGAEAFDLYERNWRHVTQDALSSEERELVSQLTQRFGHGVFLV